MTFSRLILPFLLTIITKCQNEIDFRFYYCFIVYAKNKDVIVDQFTNYMQKNITMADASKDRVSLMAQKYTLSLFSSCKEKMQKIDKRELYELINKGHDIKGKVAVDPFMNLNRNLTAILYEPLSAKEVVVRTQMDRLKHIEPVI